MIVGVTTATANSFGVPESKVSVTLGEHSGGSGRRMSDDSRRLTGGYWPVTFSVLVTAATTAPDQTEMGAALQEAFGADVLVANSYTVGEAEATPVAQSGATIASATGSGEVAPSQADSSTTIFVLGAVAFVVLFLAVLVPTLCKRRCRAMLGLKPSQSNKNAKTEGAAAVPAVRGDKEPKRNSNHEWDVDKDVARRPQDVEEGTPKEGEADATAMEAISALGLTHEEAAKFGLTEAKE